MAHQHRLRKSLGTELRFLRRALFDWRRCFLSKLMLLIGIGYLFVPIDLIPDRIPVVGHLDELSFLLIGFVGSRRLMPLELIEPADVRRSALSLWQHLLFSLRVLNADLANFFLLQYRGVDGFLITGKNSGTHWLKFMLSCAIAEQYGVAPPGRTSGRDADRLIGHPRWPRPDTTPWIGSSHTIPSVVFSWRWFARLLPHPPVVVLVRDIESAMRSNYVKWRDRYGGTVATYVRGDPSGRRYIADLWWYIHFFNRWSDVRAAQPDNVLVVRYEELQVAPVKVLRRIGRHYGMEFGDAAISAALRYFDRTAIRARLDPHDTEVIVPAALPEAFVALAPADAAFVRATLRRHLRDDFGYGYGLRRSAAGRGQAAIACSNTPV